MGIVAVGWPRLPGHAVVDDHQDGGGVRRLRCELGDHAISDMGDSSAR